MSRDPRWRARGRAAGGWLAPRVWEVVLRLIGAGLPRTGTSSLREALHQLLGAPVYHMREAFAHPEHAGTWVAAIEGHPPVWEDFLAGYAAGVDTPFCCCWRELAAVYPSAPVLLSRRADATTWYRSMAATVLPGMREMSAADPGDPMVPLFSVILRDVLGEDGDAGAAMAGYERWLATVRAGVPADRLVEWEPEDGWDPLCRALGVPVPDRAFPHENSTADFLARSGTLPRPTGGEE